ncbi:dephospho-CoA kinase [Actinomycetes bacterium]|nr:dephospho-CoA kinase [Actinomycetes bacterium]
MILIGLTGGIGSGKSEVSALLTRRGAIVIDADLIVRELQQPGQPAFIKIVEMFGSSVLATDGSLNRATIAAEVFKDKQALQKLNDLIHPLVREEMNLRVERHRNSDKVVVLDIPLLVENPRKGLDGVLVIDLDSEIAVSRLVEQRKMTVDDARARVNAQSTREQRLAIANHVIDNSGDRVALERQVEIAWSWITSLK